MSGIFVSFCGRGNWQEMFKASLQRPCVDQIMILRKLYEWDKQHLSDAHFFFFLTSPLKNINPYRTNVENRVSS